MMTFVVFLSVVCKNIIRYMKRLMERKLSQYLRNNQSMW